MGHFEALSLPDRAYTIADRVRKLVADYLFPPPTGIDYISIFTHNQEDFEAMGAQAARLGSVVFEKNGPAYRLRDSIDMELPTDIVRVRQPDPVQGLEGCADIVVPDYPGYEDIKRQLGGGPILTEVSKGDYTIMSISDTDLAVAAYFPSVRQTPRLVAEARAAAVRQLED